MIMSGNIVVPMSFVLVCDDVYDMLNSRAVCTLVRSVTGFVSISKPFFVATGGGNVSVTPYWNSEVQPREINCTVPNSSWLACLLDR